MLEGDGYVTSRTVVAGRGRPAARYRLTDHARSLFPDRSSALASELIDFIADRDGRQGVRAFLQWRQEREADRLGDVVTAEDLHGRLEQLVGALNAAGFEASLSQEGDSFKLTQSHCCVYDVARDHPEVCAYEAATFKKVLGAQVSRRETLAKGDAACVCTVKPLAAEGNI